MSSLLPVYIKEMRSYFSTPVAYLVITVFLLVSGVMYALILYDYSRFSLEVIRSGFSRQMEGLNIANGILRPTFSTLSFLMLLMMPLLTMKSFSEEKKSGTIELLFTYPIRDLELVLGKFFALLTVYVMMLAATLCYSLMLFYFKPVPLGDLFAGYLGLFLMGAAFIALGIFISSLTENQIVAAFWTFGMILIFWLIGWFAGDSSTILTELAKYLSIFEHYRSFETGIIDTRDLVYYLSFIFLFIFLTLRALESKRWRS